MTIEEFYVWCKSNCYETYELAYVDRFEDDSSVELDDIEIDSKEKRVILK